MHNKQNKHLKEFIIWVQNQIVDMFKFSFFFLIEKVKSIISIQKRCKLMVNEEGGIKTIKIYKLHRNT